MTSFAAHRLRGHAVPRLCTAAAALSMLTASLSASGCSPTHAEPDAPTATVLRIVDGDTVDIVDDTRGRLRIRVLGIDTPEVKKPGYSVGCWGPQASKFAQDTLAGQRVAVTADPSQDAHDRYGRSLAYLDKPGNWDYSIEAARAGAARSYTYGHSPVARAPQIQAAENEAKQARRGLWGPPCNGHTESAPLK